MCPRFNHEDPNSIYSVAALPRLEAIDSRYSLVAIIWKPKMIMDGVTLLGKNLLLWQGEDTVSYFNWRTANMALSLNMF